jgi:tetratricopeptide (TPR) repeat protein
MPRFLTPVKVTCTRHLKWCRPALCGRSGQRTRSALLCLAALLSGSGCITSAREESLRRSITQLEGKVEVLEKALAERDEKIKTIGSKAEYVESASSGLEDLRRQLGLTQGAVDELRIKFTRLTETGAPGGTVPGSVSGLGESSLPPESPQDTERRLAALELAIEQLSGAQMKQPSKSETPAYKSTRELTKAIGGQFAQKNYTKVNEMADAVLNSDLDASYKEIALLFKAEAAFASENYKSAALEFSNFLTRYPNSERRARALLLAGDSFVYLKQFDTAKSYYRECVQKFAEKQECKASKERLDRLGS